MTYLIHGHPPLPAKNLRLTIWDQVLGNVARGTGSGGGRAVAASGLAALRALDSQPKAPAGAFAPSAPAPSAPSAPASANGTSHSSGGKWARDDGEGCKICFEGCVFTAVGSTVTTASIRV